MNLKVLSATVLTVLAVSTSIFAQGTGEPSKKTTATPTPKPLVREVPVTSQKLSDTLAKNLENSSKTEEISRERREQAYVKLLEGQRYIWNMSRQRGQGAASGARLAKQALQKAIELNPNLAEAYTALAELALTTPPSDLNEAIALASLAVKIDKNNFGGQRILSRLYTIKSGLTRDPFDDANAQKAIGAWKELTRLDPRNAEAWAFLSEFYKRTNKPNERIEALKNWQSSAAPVEIRFYRTVFGNQANLSPEGASANLGEAYYEAGRIAEAVEILNQTVADDPENAEAVALLGKALEKADARTAATSVQTLQQAIYANPENTSLIMLLAKVQARSGNSADATKFVNDTVAKLAEKDKNAAAVLQVSLGDMYNEAGKADEAAAAYRKSLTIAGIDQNNLATDNDRDFAIAVFDKIIRAYKNANRFTEAKSAIDNARLVLGEEDSFSDRQMVALYRENGKKQEALQALKMARIRFPDDYLFLRQEATVLTELGRVDEGAAIVRTLIGKKPANQIPSPMYDDFTNYLFISSLYAEAKRGKEAIEAANQALEIAGSSGERRLIAKLTLSTAQQNSGDVMGAEKTLREILAESPGNSVAQNNLGYFLTERNEKLPEALRLIEAAVKAEPENPNYLDSLGWVYFKLGKLDLAEQNLKKALQFDATSATIHEHLGDVYQKLGKPDLAKASWQKALTFASDAEQINNIKAKLNKKTAK